VLIEDKLAVDLSCLSELSCSDYPDLQHVTKRGRLEHEIKRILIGAIVSGRDALSDTEIYDPFSGGLTGLRSPSGVGGDQKDRSTNG